MEGRAVDVMIPNYTSAQGIALGNAVNKYILDNKKHFKLEYTLGLVEAYGWSEPGVSPLCFMNSQSQAALRYTHAAFKQVTYDELAIAEPQPNVLNTASSTLPSAPIRT